MSTLKEFVNEEEVIKEGWKALTEKLGHANSVRFVTALRKGKGDSVKDLQEFWEGKSVDDIKKEIDDWKETNNII